jgi:hypothetical protein
MSEVKIQDYETPMIDVCKSCGHYKEVSVHGETRQLIDGKTKCGGCRQQVILFKNYSQIEKDKERR